MDWTGEPSAGLEQDIERLERFLGARSDLSPDARVAGLAALVNAKAAHRAMEMLTMYTGIIRDDVTMPLAEALHRFSGQAEQLGAALGRLPDY